MNRVDECRRFAAAFLELARNAAPESDRALLLEFASKCHDAADHLEELESRVPEFWRLTMKSDDDTEN